jgi:4a-hydroxytetrahydrobiopterin dehydratase
MKTKDWARQTRLALTPTQTVTRLGSAAGWQLTGSGPDVAIEKSFSFKDYFETMAFVNAVAYIAHTQDHHPALTVYYNRCVVRFNTHDVQGLSDTDFDCAQRVDALIDAGDMA